MHQYVLLEPNTRYRFSGYMKSEIQSANGVRFMLVDMKAEKHLFDTDDSINDRGWKEFTAEFTTAADTSLGLLLMGRSNTTLIRGSVLIDDLRLEKVSR